MPSSPGWRARSTLRSWPSPLVRTRPTPFRPMWPRTSGDDRVGAAPGVGGAAVRGHRSHARDRGTPGRRGAPAPRRDRCVRPGRPGARRDAGPHPDARRDPAARSRDRPRAPARRAGRSAGRPRLHARRTSSSTVASSPCAAASSTSSPATRGVPSGWSTGATRSSRSVSSLRRRSSRPRRSTRVLVPAVRELIPDDQIRRSSPSVGRSWSRIGSATASSGSPTACTSREPRRSPRSSSTTCRRSRSCCRTGAWVVLAQAQRTQDRARQAFDEGERARRGDRVAGPARAPSARRRAGRHVRASPLGVHRGARPGDDRLGERAGQPGRARGAPGRPRRPRATG